MSRVVVKKHINNVGHRQKGDTYEYKGKEYEMRGAIVERNKRGYLTKWVYLILKRIRKPGPAGPDTNKK